MNENISKHISYKEATYSRGAIHAGVSNIPNEKELKAMKLVAEECFEPLRNNFNTPIKIESFLRKHTNRSQHFRGEAIDIDNDYSTITNKEMFEWLIQNTTFDQIIWEFGNAENPDWVHISHRLGRNRGKITVAYKNNGTQYRHFVDLVDLTEFLYSFYK